MPVRRCAGAVVDAEPELVASPRDRQPAVLVAARERRDVALRPRPAVRGRVEDPQGVGDGVAGGVRSPVHVEDPERAVGGDLAGGPRLGAVRGVVRPHVVALERQAVVGRGVGVEIPLVVRAERVDVRRAGAVVGGGPAPAGVGQRRAERVERLTPVVRPVDRVAARAVRGLVALVPEVEDVPVPVRGDPRPVVDRLAGREERPVEVERVLAEAVDRPPRHRDVGDVRVDEVEVVRIVDGHVALVAEIVLLEGEDGEPGQILEAPAAVARRPRPGHAPREGGRARVGRDGELPVLLVRSGEDVAEVVGVDSRLVAVAARGGDLHRRPERRRSGARARHEHEGGSRGDRRREDRPSALREHRLPPFECAGGFIDLGCGRETSPGR